MTAISTAFGIVTRDIPTSVAFYRLLGLDISEPTEDPHHSAALPGGGRLMWDTEELMRQIKPTWQPPSGGPRLGLAIGLTSPDEVDAVYTRVVAAGNAGAAAPWDAFWGQRYAQVVDPDGVIVDLFADLP
ncbi:VOC family protein [Actinoalloteichus fjordicus]|uniref:Glyoxalase-like domain n=1 Tax=Actinoalloteichus fjordicus TaxID=1612552 RepID=A0AAC9PQF6_9PSEU|nr:VOC family protein [Actinoalloteichus fjordicus]APU12983.1 Glyoxalase-like domain [Actinoalloteichus fjordicus]